MTGQFAAQSAMKGLLCCIKHRQNSKRTSRCTRSRCTRSIPDKSSSNLSNPERRVAWLALWRFRTIGCAVGAKPLTI
ncbi:hypothetical protein RB195_003747 [Necator americanus]